MKKTLVFLRSMVSGLIIAAAILQLTGAYKGAINYAVPLVGVLMLVQGFGEWKNNLSSAFVSFAAAAFIFIVSIVVFFFS